MPLLFPLLIAASAAALPADRLFEAPDGISALAPFHGQPSWVLLARCAKAHFDDAERLQNSQFTAIDRTMAQNEGLTVEQRRDAQLKAHEDTVRNYLSIAMESVAVDRQIEIEDASAIVLAELPKLEALRSSYSGAMGFPVNSCDTIARSVSAT